MTRQQLFAGVILVGILAAWVRFFWFTDVFHTHAANAPNRASLLRVYSALQVDASASDVLQVVPGSTGRTT